MRLPWMLALVAAGLVVAAFGVSLARSDTPGRLACPATGHVDCTDPDCVLGIVEREARTVLSAIRVHVSGTRTGLAGGR